MSAAPLDLIARHDRSALEIEAIEDRLYEHNRAAVGRDDGLGLGFAARDAAGAEIGAIAGYSWADIAEIKQLWVAPGHRGGGVGRGLVETFIAEARRRGCARVWVMSYTFQAPGLYERCGFGRVVELAGWPPGHAQVVLRRDLLPPGRATG